MTIESRRGTTRLVLSAFVVFFYECVQMVYFVFVRKVVFVVSYDMPPVVIFVADVLPIDIVVRPLNVPASTFHVVAIHHMRNIVEIVVLLRKYIRSVCTLHRFLECAFCAS
jgi:hypothetical protein